MSRLREEMQVIPSKAWTIAAVLAVAFGLLIYPFAIFGDNHHPVGPFIIFSIILVVFFVYVLLMGYIAGDARRRGMRPALWVLLAMFMPSAIGILLYFILREPLLRPCPKCGKEAKSFPYCPSCGANLASTCPSCRNAVEPGWAHCARCGTQLLIA